MIHQILAEGYTQYHTQTFDQSVLTLMRDGLITEEEALKNCNHPNELLLKLKGIENASDRTWASVEQGRESKPQGGLGAEPARPPKTSGEMGSTKVGATPPDWMA